jgi:AcrR family transcriptional regulator
MSRGRAATHDQQRAHILQAATELFAQHGFASTSMNQVADACGLSKAALYHYFRDKDAMLVSITEEHVLRLRAIVDDVVAQPHDAAQRLRVLIQRFVKAYAGAQQAHRVLTEDTRFLSPVDRERVLTHERHMVQAFANAIQAHRPDLRGTPLAKPLTMLLFGMINWMFTWLHQDGELTHDAMAPIVVDLFLGGLGAVAKTAAVPKATTAAFDAVTVAVAQAVSPKLTRKVKA